MAGIAISPASVFQADKVVAASGGVAPAEDNLLLEDGDPILLEDGDKILTE